MRFKQKALSMSATLILAVSGTVTAGALIASSPAQAAPPQFTGSPTHPKSTAPKSQSTPSSTPAPSTCPDTSTSKGQVLQGLGVTGSNCSDSQVNQTLKTIVEILSIVIGAASVIVIMVSGFKYIVSAGEQNKVANAKSSLIYALVGLAVAAAAQLLVHFVLHNTNAT